MGLCDEQNKKTKIGLVIGACTGVPTILYIVASEGANDLASALMSGAVVGGISMAGYFLYECNFNLVGCSVSGAETGVCSIWGTIKSFL